MEYLRNALRTLENHKRNLQRPLPLRKVADLHLGGETTHSALFPNHRYQEIVEAIPEVYSAFADKLKPDTFTVAPSDGYIYNATRAFLAESVAGLPLHNEIGLSVLMREDSLKVIVDILRYIEGIKPWQELDYMFNEDGRLEVYKYEIRRSDHVDGAICHSIDLSNEPAIYIDRFAILNDRGGLHGHRDGRFIIYPDARISIQALTDEITRIHRAEE